MLINIVKTAAENVLKSLGPGHSEIVYANAMAVELRPLVQKVEQEKIFTLQHKNVHVGFCRLDFVLDDTFVIEIKSVSQTTLTHHTQLKRYLRLPFVTQGVLINFGTRELDFFSYSQ